MLSFALEGRKKEARGSGSMQDGEIVCVCVCVCVFVFVCGGDNQEGKLIFHIVARDRARSADFGINIEDEKLGYDSLAHPHFIHGVVS